MEFDKCEMGFGEADLRYAELKRQHDAGTIGEKEFDAPRKHLMVQDDEGLWWAKGRKDDEWYRRDETGWVRDTPGYQQDMQKDIQQRDTGVHTAGHDQAEGAVARSSGANARLWIGSGIACAVIAVLLPFIGALFGILGIYFGSLARRGGRRTGGAIVVVISVVCMLLSLLGL